MDLDMNIMFYVCCLLVLGFTGPDLGTFVSFNATSSHATLWESLTRIRCLGLGIPIDPHFHTCILVFILMSNPNTFCSHFTRLLMPAFQVSALWTKWSWWITLCLSWISEWKCWTFFPQEVCDTVDGRFGISSINSIAMEWFFLIKLDLFFKKKLNVQTHGLSWP